MHAMTDVAMIMNG